MDNLSFLDFSEKYQKKGKRKRPFGPIFYPPTFIALVCIGVFSSAKSFVDPSVLRSERTNAPKTKPVNKIFFINNSSLSF